MTNPIARNIAVAIADECSMSYHPVTEDTVLGDMTVGDVEPGGANRPNELSRFTLQDDDWLYTVVVRRDRPVR
jgi:hypothetical protein